LARGIRFRSVARRADNVQQEQRAGRYQAVPAWLPRAAYVSVALAAAFLLAAHSFKWDAVTVDTTSLGLLALLLLVPLAPYVTRLKAGGVEAEIGPREAQLLQAAAADLPPVPKEDDVYVLDAPSLEELIQRDPPLGLARLRMDLEREVRRLYEKHVPHGARRGLALGMMTRELGHQNVLPPEIAAPLAEVASLANRAVHGEYVQREAAEEIADVGLRVLNALRLMNEQDAGGK
jgi:hypothetical protein